MFVVYDCEDVDGVVLCECFVEFGDGSDGFIGGCCGDCCGVVVVGYWGEFGVGCFFEVQCCCFLDGVGVGVGDCGGVGFGLGYEVVEGFDVVVCVDCDDIGCEYDLVEQIVVFWQYVCVLCGVQYCDFDWCEFDDVVVWVL